MTGFVSLVGAGPGDADLLTRRALDRLARADLVLNDALVDEALLELAPRAKRFFVGKRAGRHSIEQRTIEHLMIRAARRGQRVVRLKCGDPFVFGRGGEEALALRDAGIPFEVVPGVSTAIAAPALAGIPVTHRGISTAFVVVAGHAPEAWQPIVADLRPGSATLVVLMGVRQRGAISAALRARGWRDDQAAAVISDAASAEQTVWRGHLADLGAAVLPDGAPGVLVIGDVVDLAPAIGVSMTRRHAPTLPPRTASLP